MTERTQFGYRTFRCSEGRRQFNERTDTPFNYLEFPSDIVFFVVLWRMPGTLRVQLSLPDLAEMCLQRGFEFTRETVREWGSALCSVAH